MPFFPPPQVFLHIMLLLSIPLAGSPCHHQETKEIISYLCQWNEGFSELTVKFPQSSPNRITIEDANHSTLLSCYLNPTSVERAAFDAISSLLFSSAYDPSNIEDVRLWQSVLFWDYQSQKNPAHLEMLGAHFETPTSNDEYSQAVHFWQFFCEKKKAGGRSHWIREHHFQQPLLTTDSTRTLSETELLEIISNIDRYGIKVDPPYKSSQKLRCHFRIKIGNQRIKLKSIRSFDLNDEYVQNVLFTRLQRIKSELLTVNPLYFNAYRSLGICYENLLNKNLNAFDASYQVFESDLHFSESINELLFREET